VAIERRNSIAITGGGIGGLTAAVSLLRAGFDVQVYEQARTLAEIDYLSDLIDIFKAEPAWNIGRNAKNSLPNLKKMGDLSAHNRRFIARKVDVDKLKDDLRIVLEEVLHIVDYPNWKG
jgi:anaerobic glycerol-3-phosphate dehydrogenase